MKTDVTQVKIRRNNDGAIIELERKDGEKRTIFLLGYEVDFILDADRYVPACFRDISYFYTFYLDSIVHVYASRNDAAEHTFFTLPTDEAILPGLRAVKMGAQHWICPPEQMEQLRNRFWPRYKIMWGDGAKERAVKHIDLLRQHLYGIFLIGANYSDGDHVRIHIQLDGWQPEDPPSFYWYILKEIDGDWKRAMNGGIIWHGDSYSVHT